MKPAQAAFIRNIAPILREDAARWTKLLSLLEAIKSGKMSPNVIGQSTEQQIRDHIAGLEAWADKGIKLAQELAFEEMEAAEAPAPTPKKALPPALGQTVKPGSMLDRILREGKLAAPETEDLCTSTTHEPHKKHDGTCDAYAPRKK